MEANSCNVPATVGFKVPARVSRLTKPDSSLVNISGVEVGGSDIVIIAGPCAVESEEQLFLTARAVKKMEPAYCAEAPSNHALLLTAFRALVKMD